MSSNRIPIMLATALAFGCSESALTPTAQSDGLRLQASVSSGVVHQVSAGGPDVCAAFGLKPGCDANFSLVAIQHADGSVTGQYIDRWARGGGFHAVINCVNVIGNDAWVSGVVTKGTYPDGTDLAGRPLINRLRDNGTSANDPPDQFSISWIDPGNNGFSASCLDAPDLPLFDAPQGQVVVR